MKAEEQPLVNLIKIFRKVSKYSFEYDKENQIREEMMPMLVLKQQENPKQKKMFVT